MSEDAQRSLARGSARPPGREELPAHERTALKEWAVLCDAMGRGELIALVRKGGIREQRSGFAVRHDRFLLYPTYFHEKAPELQPRFRDRLRETAEASPAQGTIELALVAQVAGVWAVGELDRLRFLESEHGLSWEAVESRFLYRGRPGVQVVAVRVSRLAERIVVPELRRYQGCVSWVRLEQPVNVLEAQAAVTDAAFAARLAAMRALLGEPTPVP